MAATPARSPRPLPSKIKPTCGELAADRAQPSSTAARQAAIEMEFDETGATPRLLRSGPGRGRRKAGPRASPRDNESTMVEPHRRLYGSWYTRFLTGKVNRSSPPVPKGRQRVSEGSTPHAGARFRRRHWSSRVHPALIERLQTRWREGTGDEICASCDTASTASTIVPGSHDSSNRVEVREGLDDRTCGSCRVATFVNDEVDVVKGERQPTP